ncbi:GIY-YIG nuclease family protein [Sphingosinicella sp.]|uniref:GIY-YIG nuclease family protein n=1 Tax=Sphingosinicella sp. TaxID=1917971 RepID=UPI00261056F8|nr:GIY-YIG nuclease family protein [Sphingosinicella sp.]
MKPRGWVYIMANRKGGTLYIGVTNDLARRVHEHREGLVPGFTKRYAVKTLVWYEEHDDFREAIAREKALKEWNRAWKLRLINEANPEWSDLYPFL